MIATVNIAGILGKNFFKSIIPKTPDSAIANVGI